MSQFSIITECQPVLEFVAIKRKDTGEWAIPGVLLDSLISYETVHSGCVCVCVCVSERERECVCVCVCVCLTMQGMVDAGENVSVTLKREFGEEALNTLELSPAEVSLSISGVCLGAIPATQLQPQ